MKYWFICGSILAGLSILIGAFGAHALKSKLNASDIEIFEIGVRYQIYHAFGLMIISILGYELPHSLLKTPLLLLLSGTLIFSGSLYILVLTNLRWFGAITPIGGLLLVAGWLLLSLNIYKY
mgnify:CR=1 FL=1